MVSGHRRKLQLFELKCIPQQLQGNHLNIAVSHLK